MTPLKNYLKPLALGLLVGLSACSKKDSPSDPTPMPGGERAARLSVMTSVANAQGIPQACYFFTTRDLQGGRYTNASAVPIEVGNIPYYHEGRFYAYPSLMGSLSNELRAYGFSATGSLEQVGKMALKGGAGPTSMLYHAADKAYLSDWANGKVLIFNPTTFTLTGEIDLSPYAQPNAKVRPSILLERDGILYVPLNQADTKYQPAAPNRSDILLVDTQTDKPLKLISDTKHGLSFPTRPLDDNSIFVDEAGDIYLNCLGTFEQMLPDSHTGILRIKKGETDFDPNYVIKLTEKKIQGMPEKDSRGFYLAGVAYVGGGKLLGIMGIPTLDPNFADNPYGSHIHQLVSIDLPTGTITAVPGITPSSIQAFGLCYDGQRYAYVSHADQQGQGIYRYDARAGKFDPATSFFQVEGNVAGLRYIPAR